VVDYQEAHTPEGREDMQGKETEGGRGCRRSKACLVVYISRFAAEYRYLILWLLPILMSGFAV
jgi:hypothetical protein